MQLYQTPVCETCGEYLRTHEDHSGQYCPVCSSDDNKEIHTKEEQ